MKKRFFLTAVATALVAHLPFVCHHVRAERPETTDLAAPTVEQSRRALEEAMQRRGLAAAPFLPEAAHQRRLNLHQLRWAPKLLAARDRRSIERWINGN